MLQLVSVDEGKYGFLVDICNGSLLEKNTQDNTI